MDMDLNCSLRFFTEVYMCNIWYLCIRPWFTVLRLMRKVIIWNFSLCDQIAYMKCNPRESSFEKREFSYMALLTATLAAARAAISSCNRKNKKSEEAKTFLVLVFVLNIMEWSINFMENPKTKSKLIYFSYILMTIYCCSSSFIWMHWIQTFLK